MVFATKRKGKQWFFCGVGVLAVGLAALSAYDFARGFYTSRAALETDPVAYYETTTLPGKVLALTFDDGPHPERTPEILAVLQKHDVPATFFFLGVNALQNPRLVREVHEAGYEIGNHTFTHAPEVHESPERVAFELQAANAVLRNITREDTTLYRPPYLLDSRPASGNETPRPVRDWVAGHGYAFAGADVDSLDWAATSPEEVVDRVLAGVESGRLILLHDGGSAEHTAAALDIIIPALKARGYTFGTVSQALGVEPSAAIAGPTLPFLGAGLAFVPAVSTVGKLLFNLIKIGLGLIILRLFVLAVFLVVPQKERHLAPWRRSAAVIVPAHNERENIGATLESILKSSHPVGEIIVVDDGSTDGTGDIARSYVAQYPRRMRLIECENGGKAAALMRGIHATDAEIVVTMDGDTIFDRHAIDRLLRHFNDPSVGAVAGRVCITRNSNLLNLFQHLEYTISQQVEKKVFERFNAVSVVPGPVGAWRRKELLAAGGYGVDTLVEDQDMTLAMLKAGHRIRYEPEALAYTEPPHTVTDFLKQRLRWTFGTLQCLWKYKTNFGDLRRPGLGFVVLPNILVFGFGMSLLYPVADLVFLASIPLGYWPAVLGLYIGFVIIDLAYGTLGLTGEKARGAQLVFLPLQRLFYRFAMYYVVARSLARALDGTGLLWEKVVKLGQTHGYTPPAKAAPSLALAHDSR